MLKHLILIILPLILISCLSDEEIRMRQLCALDCSGSYSTSYSSDLYMTVNIINEFEYHDILVTIYRTITDEEIELFKENSVYIGSVISKLGSNIILGDGYSYSWWGGENYSDDFGKTSQIYVTSEDYEFQNTEAQYTFEATRTKFESSLRGTLELELSKRAYDESSEDSTDDRSSASFNFTLYRSNRNYYESELPERCPDAY